MCVCLILSIRLSMYILSSLNIYIYMCVCLILSIRLSMYILLSLNILFTFETYYQRLKSYMERSLGR